MKATGYIFFGIVITYIVFLFTTDCHHHSDIKIVNTVEYRFRDSVEVETLRIIIPKPYKKTIYRTDTLWKMWVRDSFCTDTLFQPTEVVFNEYYDSVKQGKMRLDYKITTFGELVQFEPVLHYYDRDTTITITKAPKWSFGTGIWTDGKSIHPSVNVYYRGFGVGWNNGISLTKQWSF